MPPVWITMMKKAISTLTPEFSARRMLKEYDQKLYLPASKGLVPAGNHPWNH
jgi:starch phosphorylase